MMVPRIDADSLACLCCLVLALGLVSGMSCAAPHGRDRSVVDGSVRFQVLSPMLVRMEYSPGAKFVDEASVSVINRDDWPGAPFESKVKDGWLSVATGRMTVRYRVDSGPFAADNLAVTWRDEAGEHTWKPGDKDEANLGGLVGDIAHRTTPVLDPGPLSRSGYFLLDDSRSALRDKAADWVKPQREKDSQDWYLFIYGRDYSGMLSTLAKLIGPPPMVPRYVLGVWFGSRADYSADEWKLIAQRFREERIPVDVFVLDSLSWTNVVWAGYDWDPEQMPDPKEFFAWMHEHGIHTTLNEHYGPLSPQNDHNFEAIRKEMGLPADTKEIAHDLANKKYAGLFMELLHKPALDMGMDFWWQDGCAGANMEGLDPMEWTREIEYEGSERITGKRAFVFCRFGAWGSHRYGGFFSGDLIPEWGNLKVLVPFDVQCGNMLTPYVSNLAVAVYGISVEPELYVRWTQFGSFSPIFWYHGLWGLRLPWEYGEVGTNIVAGYLRLRERLIPYTYTYSRIAHETGMPIVRGLYLDYPDQDQSYAFKEQYLYGRDMLVAPVTDPAFGRPALKDIYLPAGETWFDYFTGRMYAGGQVIAHECPLERMPVFARAGAIIPMSPQVDYADEKPLDPLTLDVYASDKPSTFRLYEDDGASLDYREGKFAWTPITFTPGSDGSSTVEVGPTEGRFAGQLKSRRYEVRIHGLLEPDSVSVNGEKVARIDSDGWGGGWTWDSKQRVTTVRIAEALPIGKKVVVKLDTAGGLADAIALQKVLEFRERVRTVKLIQKLKYALILVGQEHGKPPRVIQETEKVEARLNDIIANPLGLSRNMPDLKSMTKQLLAAMVDKPFDSTRTIPDLNQTCLEATKSIENVTFESEEVRKMTAALLGLDLHARVVWDDPEKHFVGPYLHVQAKLDYDSDLTGPATVAMQIELPESNPPGWGRNPTVQAANGYTQFDIFYPFPEKPSGQVFRVKAALTWDGGRVETYKEVEWRQ